MLIAYGILQGGRTPFLAVLLYASLSGGGDGCDIGNKVSKNGNKVSKQTKCID